MVNLKDLFITPRKSAQSYAELCPWFSLIEDDMVLCNDGTLLVAYEFRGIDPEGKTDDVLNGQIQMLQSAFEGFNENIIIWSYLDKRRTGPYVAAEYENEVAAYLDQKWAEQINKKTNYSVRTTLFIGFRRASVGESVLQNINYRTTEHDQSVLSAAAGALKMAFSPKTAISRIEGALNEMIVSFRAMLSAYNEIATGLIGATPLKSSLLLGALFSKMNLASTGETLNASKYGAYLAQRMVADKVVRFGNKLRFEGPSKTKYLATMSGTDFPEELCSTHIDALLNVDAEFTICQIYEILDTRVVRSMISRAEAQYRLEVKSLGTRVIENLSGKDTGKVDLGNLALADEAQDALADQTENNMLWGYHSIRFLAYGDDPASADKCAESLAGKMRVRGYGITQESTGLFAAFLSSLPGNSTVNPRKYLAPVSNIADLCPIRSFDKGEETHPLYSKLLSREQPCHGFFNTASSVGYGFNLHLGDVGSTLIMGPTGAGKTSYMNFITSQFAKYNPSRFYLFDKDYSASVPSAVIGAVHIDVTSTTNKVKGNPVKRMLRNGDHIYLIKWLTLLAVGYNGESLSEMQHNNLAATVAKMTELPAESWRLGSFFSILKGVDRNLAFRFTRYVNAGKEEGTSDGVGPYAQFFDNDEDTFDAGSSVCIETGEILQNPDLATPFLDYYFYAIDKSMNGKVPTMIYIEEAWFALSNTQFRSKLVDWLRTMRRKRGFVIMATQAMSELSKMESDLNALLSNIPTRIFLPPINNSIEEFKDMYRKIFNLNDEQLSLLEKGVPHRDYMIVKGTTTKIVSAIMPETFRKINEACTVEELRDEAIRLSHENRTGWAMSFIKESLNA